MGFTNSSLATYVRISPNSTNPRNHAIDTITIHTMAGNLSVQTCGELFASRKASSNYGIDSNGNIALYVEEKNRTWCSSNSANDHRAVTIEVASINTTDWRPSDAAYAALIRLVADICKRNNIKQLVWSTDKNTRVNHRNGANMTVHRDYAAKACPGDWLYNNMGRIASEVNKIINTPTTEDTVIPDSAEGSSVNTNNVEVTIWNYLHDHGMTNDYAKAGLMGNLFAESGLVPNNLQNSYESKLGYNDITYTAAVDNKSYTNFVNDSAGYGLAQWTYWTRKKMLLDLANATNRSIGDLSLNLDNLQNELDISYGPLKAALNKCTSVQEASDLVLTQFEKPADQSASVKAKRASYGKIYYNKYASAIPVANKFPYSVRVTCNSLRIRSGAGTNYSQVGSITDRGVYTITEEKTGIGAKIWGKLKSGAGWIAVDDAYVSKL